jgi:hypothetical protein
LADKAFSARFNSPNVKDKTKDPFLCIAQPAENLQLKNSSSAERAG